MRTNCLVASLFSLGLSLGVLSSTSEAEAAKPRQYLSDYIKKKRAKQAQGAVSRATYIKGGKHAQVKKVRKGKKARKARWVRVKVKKSKKAPTQWALIRKDRYPYATTIAIAAKRHGVPVRIAIAVGIQESALDPKALGDRGASYGLMQVKCTTARELGYQGTCAGLFNPTVNAHWGCRYLRLALDRGGVWLYNQGIHAKRPVKAASRYAAKVAERARRLDLLAFRIPSEGKS
ncbi:MAG: transglycosylase SLT domain-containing protein [Nitrospira sp.]